MARKKSKKSHEDLASDVDAFLAAGGEIQEVDHTANKGWRERKQPGRQHIPLHINPRHRWARRNYEG